MGMADESLAMASRLIDENHYPIFFKMELIIDKILHENINEKSLLKFIIKLLM